MDNRWLSVPKEKLSNTRRKRLTTTKLIVSTKNEKQKQKSQRCASSKSSVFSTFSDNDQKHLPVVSALNCSQISPEIIEIMKQKPIMCPIAKEFFEHLREENADKVKRMLKNKDVDINTRDTDDPLLPTPLLVAAEMDSAEMVKVLMKNKHKKPNVNDENIKGKRAIWYAAKNSNTEMAGYLLSQEKCEVNIVDKETGCAPLYRAIISSATDVCQLLIQGGADVNLRRLGFDAGNDTPLMKAIQVDNRDICQLLLNSLCKLQTKNESGLNALHYAVAYCRYDICDLLLENGAKMHARSNGGVTAMTVAITDHNAAMTKLLLKRGYKMNKKYKWKETPLEQAIKLHAIECALTLMQYGCDIAKEKGRSFMKMAVNEKLIRIIKFLVALNPLVLNEEWLQQKRWPVSIYRRQDITNWLEREAKTPRTLKQICRYKVFRIMGTHGVSKADELPLPTDLKEYLKFKEFVKDEYYSRRPLETKDCPFDCPPLCSLKNCAPIEVSDSETNSDSDDELTSE